MSPASAGCSTTRRSRSRSAPAPGTRTTTFPEVEFPFSAATLVDPISGASGALLRGDASDPKLIETNTSTEYWQKGASLLHTDPLGTQDVALPANVRGYLLAGTQHGGKAGMPRDNGPCVNPRNWHDPMPAIRALLVALDEWVVTDRAPPDSRLPRIADGTLVPAEDVALPPVPGLTRPRAANDVAPLADWTQPQPPARTWRALVPQVDADGNERAGIRLPDIAVPRGTFTGWNLYAAPYPAGRTRRPRRHVPGVRRNARGARSGRRSASVAAGTLRGCGGLCGGGAGLRCHVAARTPAAGGRCGALRRGTRLADPRSRGRIGMTDIYVDGDACPVREEVFRVADRLGLRVFVVSNGSRPIRPSGRPNVQMITVAATPDAADDWIAEHITPADVCVTADIPLASRCLEKSAYALAPSGKRWTGDNIGNALAGRAVAQHMRELGMTTGGPAPLTKQDRSRFLGALDTVVQAARRGKNQPRG